LKFRTEIIPREFKGTVKYSDKIFSAGSCFAQNISEKLKEHFFAVLNNPFGTLYNVVSILNMFELILKRREISEDALIFYDGLWHSFFHNTEFSSASRNTLLGKIESSLLEAKNFAGDTNVVILTFGTSFIYTYSKLNLIVANCHKLPQNRFERRLLTAEENFEYIKKIIKILKEELSKEVKIILTVSPVRHLKDGAHFNHISKGNLLLAVRKAIDYFDEVFYFPSYEILLDDLRDYRFYAQDLVHPNNFAIEYIWEKFKAAFFDRETVDFIKVSEKISKGLNHKFISSDRQIIKTFLEKEIKKAEEALSKFPHSQLIRPLNELKKRKKELEKSI